MAWDTFTLPPGARRMASSEACTDQPFEMERAIGVQFRPEVTEEAIEERIARCGGLRAGGPHIQNADAIRAGYARLEEPRQAMRQMLDRIDAGLFSSR